MSNDQFASMFAIGSLALADLREAEADEAALVARMLAMEPVAEAEMLDLRKRQRAAVQLARLAGLC